MSEKYFSGNPDNGSWRDESNELLRRLSTIFALSELNVKHRLEQAKTHWTRKLHAKLRQATQLGKGRTEGMSVSIEISNKVPPPVIELMRELDDATLWTLVSRTNLMTTQKTVRDMSQRFDLLSSRVMAELGRTPDKTAIDSTEQFIGGLLRSSQEECDRIIREMRGCSQDILGAYFFKHERIELYWFTHWLIAADLGVAPEELAVGTMIHELAHFYHHRGPDSDGHTWDTDAFATADDRICEGLAEFHTVLVADALAEDHSPGVRSCVRELSTRLPDAYRTHQTWVPHHRKRAEIVRQALVAARTNRIVHYDEFFAQIVAHSQALGG